MHALLICSTAEYYNGYHTEESMSYIFSIAVDSSMYDIEAARRHSILEQECGKPRGTTVLST